MTFYTADAPVATQPKGFPVSTQLISVASYLVRLRNQLKLSNNEYRCKSFHRNY